MDPRIFTTELMGLRERMLAMPLEQRFAYDPMLRMLFIDFRQLTITSNRDVARIKAEVERRIGPLGHKVYAIVNYRDCRIEPAVQASYQAMVEALEDRCYLGVTRYGLSDALEPDAGRSSPAHHPPHTLAGWDDAAKSLLAVS
jgi:propionate CoA-transferase